MPGPSVQITVVSNRLPEVQEKVRPLISAVVRKTAADIEALAKTLCPVRTGNLRNSISWQPEDDTHAIVSTPVEYAPYVEFGTRRQAPQPFMGPAANAVLPALIEAVARIVGNL